MFKPPSGGVPDGVVGCYLFSPGVGIVGGYWFCLSACLSSLCFWGTFWVQLAWNSMVFGGMVFQFIAIL